MLLRHCQAAKAFAVADGTGAGWVGGWRWQTRGLHLLQEHKCGVSFHLCDGECVCHGESVEKVQHYD